MTRLSMLVMGSRGLKGMLAARNGAEKLDVLFYFLFLFLFFTNRKERSEMIKSR